MFEWNNDCVFITPGKLGGTAFVRMNDSGEERLAAIGYYAGGAFKTLNGAYQLVNADQNGNENEEYTIPDGWNLVP